MAKYYVDAGKLRKIIDKPTPKLAAVAVFESLENSPVESLNSITIVSESGFDSNNDNDWCFSTMELLEQSDQISNYKPEK